MPQFVKDWMSKNFTTIKADCLLSTAISLLCQNNEQFIFYIDPYNDIFVLSTTDIKEHIPQQNTIKVMELMTPVKAYAHPDWDLEQALLEMQKQDVRYLPVIDDLNNLVGVLSIEAFFVAVQEIKWKADSSLD